MKNINKSRTRILIYYYFLLVHINIPLVEVIICFQQRYIMHLLLAKLYSALYLLCIIIPMIFKGYFTFYL